MLCVYPSYGVCVCVRGRIVSFVLCTVRTFFSMVLFPGFLLCSRLAFIFQCITVLQYATATPSLHYRRHCCAIYVMAEELSEQLSLATPAAAVVVGLLCILTMNTLAQQFNYLGAVLMKNIKEPTVNRIIFIGVCTSSCHSPIHSE